MLTDLSLCRPPGAIAGNRSRCTWQTVSYEAQGIKGIMLTSAPEDLVPEVEYPLASAGWHAVFLGLWKGGVTVELTGDAADRYLRPDHNGTGPLRFQEVFWKCADLTGRNLLFKHDPNLLQPVPKFGNCGTSCVAWIKLVPMTGKQVERWQAAALTGDNKRMIGHHDFSTMQGKNRAFTSPATTRSQIEPYRNSDFEKLLLEYWHNGEGVQAYRTAIDYAHEIGLQVYLARRMGSMPVNPIRRIRDRDGAELPRLSYAYPESQDQTIGVLEQMASYRPDGIALFFHKGMPFLRFETSIVRSFLEATGTDPLKLPEDDPEWLRHRAGFLTGYLRRVRTRLDEYTTRSDMAKFGIAVYVLATRDNNLLFGLDPETWIREGLVDEVIASSKLCPQAGERISIFNTDDNGPNFDYLVAVAANTDTRIYCDLSPAGDTGRYAEPETYRRLAMDLYARGVHAPCIWDAHTRHQLPRQWNMIARLGHKDELTGMDHGEGALHRDIKVDNIGGETVNRWG